MNRILLLLAILLIIGLQLAAIAQSDRRGVWAAGSARSYDTYGNNNANRRGGRESYSAPSSYSRNYSPQKGARIQAGTKYDIMESITSGGISRSFVVHVPPRYTPAKSLPCVVALHGQGMNIDGMRALTLFDVPADQSNFIVVYPSGIGGGWNAGGLKPKTSVDDVGFINDLFAFMRKKYHVDSRQIYVCGMSNGGQMVETIACSDLSRQIAAIGIVAITGYISTCSNCGNKRPIPVCMFLGTEDPLVPRHDYEAKKLGKIGESFGVADLAITPFMAKYADIMSADQVEEFWCTHNGVSSPRVESMPDRDTRDGCRVKRETYGSGTREFVLYTIEGGGHTWPGGLGWVAEERLGRTCMDINCSQLLWDFFRNHTL